MFKQEYEINEVFGDDYVHPKETVGDMAFDEQGQRIMIVNSNGTHLRVYSIFEIRDKL
jgi:hypothetical protein